MKLFINLLFCRIGEDSLAFYVFNHLLFSLSRHLFLRFVDVPCRHGYQIIFQIQGAHGLFYREIFLFVELSILRGIWIIACLGKDFFPFRSQYVLKVVLRVFLGQEFDLVFLKFATLFLKSIQGYLKLSEERRLRLRLKKMSYST